MDNKRISSSLEDYLEEIDAQSVRCGHAHLKALAEHFDVKKSQVQSAMQRLRAHELITVGEDDSVRLTPAGAERAAVIRNRHKAMRIFFENVLKLSAEDADDAACKIEHVIGEKVLARFVCLAEDIANLPECEALRKHLETSLPQLCRDEDALADLIPLSELPEGASAIVVKVSDNLRGKKKFADLGLVHGTLLKVEGHAPFGNLLRVRVLFSSLSMRSQDAANILVRLTHSNTDPSL